jgi:probable phosphoglycerate mutase
MLVLLVRHGQSVGNVEGRFQQATTPLTPRGRAESRAVAQMLASRGDVTHLYTSPLTRALETAGIIAQAVNEAPVIVPGLAEIDTGRAAGMLRSDWRRANPDMARILANPDRGVMDLAGWDGGESGLQFRDRVIQAYREILHGHAGADDVAVIVAHGGSLAWIAALAHGDPLHLWPTRRSGFSHCSMVEIRVDPLGRAEEMAPA